jgi:hypothetical protein
MRSRPGSRCHADRLAEAWVAEEYYAGRNAQFLQRERGRGLARLGPAAQAHEQDHQKGDQGARARPLQPRPDAEARGDAAADTWLQDVYRQNHVNSLMQEADRKSTLQRGRRGAGRRHRPRCQARPALSLGRARAGLVDLARRPDRGVGGLHDHARAEDWRPRHPEAAGPLRGVEQGRAAGLLQQVAGRPGGRRQRCHGARVPLAVRRAGLPSRRVNLRRAGRRQPLRRAAVHVRPRRAPGVPDRRGRFGLSAGRMQSRARPGTHRPRRPRPGVHGRGPVPPEHRQELRPREEPIALAAPPAGTHQRGRGRRRRRRLHCPADARTSKACGTT